MQPGSSLVGLFQGNLRFVVLFLFDIALRIPTGCAGAFNGFGLDTVEPFAHIGRQVGNLEAVLGPFRIYLFPKVLDALGQPSLSGVQL